MNTELKEKLEKHNVQYIETLDDFKKIIEFVFRDKKPVFCDKKPRYQHLEERRALQGYTIEYEINFNTDDLCFIMMDNRDYNQTYLIDLFNDYIESESIKQDSSSMLLDEMKVYYVDSIDIKSHVTNFGEPVEIEDPDRAEHFELYPTFLLVDKKSNTVNALKENIMSVLTVYDIEYLFHKVLESRKTLN